MNDVLRELSDMELMEVRKSATGKTALDDDDLRAIAATAAEYVRRGYGVSGLWHLDTADYRINRYKDIVTKV